MKSIFVAENPDAGTITEMNRDTDANCLNRYFISLSCGKSGFIYTISIDIAFETGSRENTMEPLIKSGCRDCRSECVSSRRESHVIAALLRRFATQKWHFLAARSKFMT
jgi:hypothetical protein